MNTFAIISRFLFFVNWFLMKKTELSYNSALKNKNFIGGLPQSLEQTHNYYDYIYTLYIYIILFNFCQAYFFV